MSQFLEQTRRATQKVLQTVGIAKESSDDEEFVAAFQDYNVLTSTVKEIGSDIRTLQSGLERLVNSTGSLVQHLQGASDLLSRNLTAISGGGDAASAKLLETLTIQLADAQREIVTGSLSKLLALINNAVVPQLLKECKDDPLTAGALDKRKRAHLDYDAKLRSHSSSPHQVEDARRAFDQLTATATAILTEKAKVRTAAIVSAAAAVTKGLREHYELSAAALASSAEVAALLGSYVNAPGAPKKQQQQQPQQQQPKQQQAAAAAAAAAAPQRQKVDSPRQATQKQPSGGNATFFDMLDSSEIMPSNPSKPSQQQQQQKPQSQSQPQQQSFFDILGSDGGVSPAPATAPKPAAQARQANTLDIFAQTHTQPAAKTASASDLLSGWDGSSGAAAGGSASSTLADLMGTQSQSQQQQNGDILMPSSVHTSYGSSAASAGSFASMFGDLGIDLQGPGAAEPVAAELPPDETAVLATKEDVERWANDGGRGSNLRALLATMDTVLWEGAGWKKITLADLVDPASVKNYYKKAITVVHPDKVVGARRQELARFIFAALRQSHDAFRRELEAQEAARARAQAMARRSGAAAAAGGDDVD